MKNLLKSIPYEGTVLALGIILTLLIIITAD
jgi:hypothetical protein